jgi:hypothetical protein
MPVPRYQEFMRPLLGVLSDGQERFVKAAYALAAVRLGLTEGSIIGLDGRKPTW